MVRNPKLISNSDIVLSDSQKQAKSKFTDWFTNNKSLMFTLSGSAGTGKTWLVDDLIKTVIKPKRVVVSAPTHKAVRVIENFTNTKGFTIHSIHGLRPNFNISDFNINNIKFQSAGVDKFNKYDLIIIDEASMIGQSLHKLNSIRSTQHNTKILYIGDRLQLSPVKEHNISEVFNTEYRYNLTDIIRQKTTSPLLELLILLRDDVLNDSATFLNHIRTNPSNISDGMGYKTSTLNTFLDNVKVGFMSDEFKHDINSYRIATYTNPSVNFWNSYIRNYLTDSKDILTVGDKLMGYKTVVDEYFQPIIINSNDYKVVDVQTKMSDDKFQIFDIIIEDYERGFTKNIYIVDHKHPSFNVYRQKIATLHRNAIFASAIEKGKLWKDYYHYKDTFMTMVDFDLVYDGRVQGSVKREIDYAYAVTIHKLQGSTITNVFLDAMTICYYKGNKKYPRINTYNNKKVIDTRNRLLYTGLSRAKNIGEILYY